MIRLYYRLEKNWGGTHKGLPLFKKIGQKCHTPQPILDHGIASCRRPPPRDGDARNSFRRNRERCPRWAAGGRRSRGRPADPNRAPPPPPPPCGVGATRRRVARRTPSPPRCRESPPSTPARRQAHRDEAEPLSHDARRDRVDEDTTGRHVLVHGTAPTDSSAPTATERLHHSTLPGMTQLHVAGCVAYRRNDKDRPVRASRLAALQPLVLDPALDDCDLLCRLRR